MKFVTNELNCREVLFWNLHKKDKKNILTYSYVIHKIVSGIEISIYIEVGISFLKIIGNKIRENHASKKFLSCYVLL